MPPDVIIRRRGAARAARRRRPRRLGRHRRLAGTTCMATGVMLTKRWGRSLPVLAATGWQLVAGGLVLTPVMFALEGPPPALTAENVAGHLWLGLVGTALAYTLWFRGAESLP
ncbi:MAG: EamA family transporter, partial [Acidimicrobiia bacterium]